MKAKSVFLAGVGCVLVFLAGCEKPNVKQSIQTTDSNTPASAPATGEAGAATAQTTDSNVPASAPVAVKAPVIWDGNASAQDAIPDFFEGAAKGGAFPKSMVGVWEAGVVETTGSKWGIKFEPDGSIKKIIHFLAGPVNIAEGGVQANGPDPGTYYLFAMGPCEARYMPKTRMIKVRIIVDYYIMKLPAGDLEGRTEDYFEGPVSGDGKTWNVKWWDFSWLKDAAIPDINTVRANPEPLDFEKIDLSKLDVNQPATGKSKK